MINEFKVNFIKYLPKDLAFLREFHDFIFHLAVILCVTYLVVNYLVDEFEHIADFNYKRATQLPKNKGGSSLCISVSSNSHTCNCDNILLSPVHMLFMTPLIQYTRAFFFFFLVVIICFN
jgi:hypothetical protein